MKVKFALLMLIAVNISCMQSGKSEAESNTATTGTLHASLVSDWKSATDENKWATCLDFAHHIKTEQGEVYDSDIEMKADALYLKTCIDEAVKGNHSDHSKVAEIAAMCLILKEAE